MNIYPLQDTVLIEPLKEELSSGLIIPEAVDREPINKGVVRKIGKDVTIVSEGDKVIYKPYGFNELKIEEITFLFGREEDIIATYD